MNTRNSSKSSLFLIELIIAILFFAIGSAICVRGFVKAHSLSVDAQDLSFASAQVSSAASVLKYTDGSFEEFCRYFPDAAQDKDGFLVFYDSDREACKEENAFYTLHAETYIKSDMVYADLYMENNSKESIYKLNIHFVPSADRKEALSDES